MKYLYNILTEVAIIIVIVNKYKWIRIPHCPVSRIRNNNRTL